MSKFNIYAEKVNNIAEAAFKEYREAEEAYKKAEEQARQYPQRNGFVDAQYAAKSARANANYLEAKENYDAAKRAFRDHVGEIGELRKGLIRDLDDFYAADPAAVDGNTLELLKSGILKPAEYSKLMQEAIDNGNFTMARMIAKYADDAAAKIAQKYGENSEEAYTLRMVSHLGNRIIGRDILQAFDTLAEVFRRAVDNPGMINHWSELTAEIIDGL